MVGRQPFYVTRANDIRRSVVSAAVAFGRKICLFYHLTTNLLAGQFREESNFFAD